MKKNKLPGRQSQAYNILSLVAVSGELPVDQIARLCGGNAYKTKLIRIFKQKKLIATYYSDKLRGYRLTGNSRTLLLEENNERFEYFLTGSTETNQPKYEITRRLRLKSIAETYVTMQNAGVAIYKDEKPAVFCSDKIKSAFPLAGPAFYSSREIKEHGAEYIQIRGTRSVGVLLTETQYFVVYNTGSSLLKWEMASESIMNGLMVNILCGKRTSHQYSMADETRGLMLGSTMEQLYQLLTNKGNSAKNYFTLKKSNYNKLLYLPNDSNGELVLRLLCDDDKTNEFRYILSKNLYDQDPDMAVENDAVDENGYPVLFAYDCDMPRIERFNSAIETYKSQGTIICFDFQADILKRYCCADVIFQEINLKEFERWFFKQ